MVALVDADHVWHKAAIGTSERVVERAQSYCDIAIQCTDFCFIPDAAQDGGLAEGPHGASGLPIRFFAAAPITTPGGERIGTVCVADRQPRAAVTEHQRAALIDLAALVMAHFIDASQRARFAGPDGQADSAALVARIDASDSCDDAMGAVAAELAARFTANTARVWKMLTPEAGMRELACHAATGRQSRPAALQPDLSRDGSVAIQAALGGKARCVPRAALADTNDPLAAVMAEDGATYAIIQPACMGEHRYSTVLTLSADDHTVQAIAAEVQRLFAELVPQLQRKAVGSRLRLLTQALDAATDGMLITEADPQGPRIVYANAAFTRMIGQSFTQLVGRSLQTLQSDPADPTLNALLTPLLSGMPAHRSLCQRSKPAAQPDAPETWIEIDVTPVQDAAGGIAYWIAVLRDVTQRKLAEQEAREHAASFRLMFDDNPLPMVLYDTATLAIGVVNASAIQRYGYPHAQFTRLSLLDLVPDQDREEVRISASQSNDAAASHAWTHVCADGEQIRVQATTLALTFNGQRMRLGVFWDVTEIERTRDALRQSNQDLLILAGQLQARTADLTEVNRRAKLGMWRMPPDGGPAEWTQEMFEIFGRPVQQPGPDFATALTWIAEGDRTRVREIIARVIEQRLPQSFEFRAVQPHGGMRHCLANLHPACGPRGQLIGLRGFCQDITERKDTEMALLRAEKLKTIGQFTGSFAHDFNNLLTVMMLNTEEAVGSLPEDHPVQALLAPVLQAAARGSELTSHLLSYARRAALEPMHVSLLDLFDGLKPLLDRILGSRFNLIIHHDDGSVQPFVDPARLENALLNLVINARDAMPSGGDIRIETALITLDAGGGGSWSEFLAGQYAVISIKDNGSGIPPDVFPRIFEPFFTTKPAGKGSGLGLSMVQSFIKQSGGQVELVSEAGAGTRATLYLPLQARAGGPDTPKPAATTAMPRKVALLVEDQPEVLTTVRQQLVSFGFEVIVASDASRAMDHITDNAVLDLLFAGIEVSGSIDGTQLADIARQLHPSIRILLTSGDMADAAALTSDLALATEFLQKPYSRAELSARLTAMFPNAEAGPGGRS